MASVFGNLKKNFIDQLQDPKSLMILILILAIFIDFMLQGRLKYISYLSYQLQLIFKGSDWQFIVILLLLLIKR